MDIVMGIGCLAIIAAYFVREQEHKKELRASYEKGYKKGLNELVVKMCSEEAE